MTIDWTQQVTAAQHDALAEKAARDIQKRERAEATAAIVVETVTGKRFQGDEISQGRMARVLSAYFEELPDGEVDWILADNSVATVTMAELDEALRLAVDAQNDIWQTFALQTNAPRTGD